MSFDDPSYEEEQEIRAAFEWKDKRIADLEAKLAAAQKELAEAREIHRQIANGIRDLGKNLIEDTCG